MTLNFVVLHIHIEYELIPEVLDIVTRGLLFAAKVLII